MGSAPVFVQAGDPAPHDLDEALPKTTVGADAEAFAVRLRLVTEGQAACVVSRGRVYWRRRRQAASLVSKPLLYAAESNTVPGGNA